MKISKFATISGTIFSLLYIIPLLITKDPDFIVFTLGPFGIFIWIVQWIAFVFGGWISAIISTTLYLFLLGYVLGKILEKIIKWIEHKKIR